MNSRPTYTGILDRKQMPENARFAYEAYNGAKARSKKAGFPPPEMSVREFMGWWLENLKTFTGTVATCGRIDHSKGYSWDNISMQDMRENSAEGAKRNRLGFDTRLKNGRKIHVYVKGTDVWTGSIPTIREASRFFGVSQRLIQFLVRGKYKNSKKIKFDLRMEKK